MKKEIRAYHIPTKSWRFAVMGQDGTYTRVDPHAGEELVDFNCYEVRNVVKNGNTTSFTVGKKINLPKTYS